MWVGHRFTAANTRTTKSCVLRPTGAGLSAGGGRSAAPMGAVRIRAAARDTSSIRAQPPPEIYARLPPACAGSR